MSSPITPTDTTDTEQKQEQQKTIEIPLDQYNALVQGNLNSHLNTLSNLDDWDKMIATMANCQIFAMNIKEKIKTNQLGLNKPTENSQQQNKLTTTTDKKTNAQ